MTGNIIIQSFLKAGSKDPRGMVRQSVPYSPTVQADRLQSHQRTLAERGNTIPLEIARQRAIEGSPSADQTKRVDYSYFVVDGVLTGDINSFWSTPQLLVPANPRRSSLVISNNSTDAVAINSLPVVIAFTFPGIVTFPIDNPFGVRLGTVAANTALGRNDPTFFQEDGGLVNTGDVWIMSVKNQGSTVAPSRTTVVAFEGTPAL